MMPEPTIADIQVLIDRPATDGALVSCYVDTSVAGYQSSWLQRLRNEAARIEQRLADDPAARRRFADDLAVIERALDEPAARRARGMALFSSAAQGFFRAFPLGVAVQDVLVLDERPYLVPLLQAMHRQRRYLVVLADSHRARLYAAGWGHTHLLHEFDEAVPRHQRMAGELWGKEQATIARHREDHILHVRKEIVRAIERAWDEAPFRGLILLGQRDVIADVRDALPPGLAGRVVHEGPHGWVSGQPTIDAKVRAALDEALRLHDARLVAELERRLAEHTCVAVGPQEVVDALWNGQLVYPGYIVLEPDRGQTAARCTACGAVSTIPRSECASCHARCETVNLWQEILLFAARHDVPAHIVATGGGLARYGGAAAMLAREGPWEPVAEGLGRRVSP